MPDAPDTVNPPSTGAAAQPPAPQPVGEAGGDNPEPATPVAVGAVQFPILPIAPQTVGPVQVPPPETVFTAADDLVNTAAALSEAQQVEMRASLGAGVRLDSIQEGLAGSVSIGNGLRLAAREVKPCVVVIDDDGQREADDYYRILVDKGIPMTLAIISGQLNDSPGEGPLSRSEIQKFVDIGCEVAGHSVDHVRIGELATYAEKEAQIGPCMRALQAEGWKVENFIYPYGSFDAETKEICAKYCRSAGAVSGDTQRPNPRPLDTYSFLRVGAWSYCREGSTLQDYKDVVDKAKRENKMAVFMLHAWHEDHNMAEFEQLVDYIQSQDVDILTLSEALDRHSNLLEVQPSVAGGGRVAVDSLGGVHGTREDGTVDEGVTRLPLNSLGVLDPAAAYPKGISWMQLNSGSAHGFPASGELVTHRRVTEKGYGQQILYPHGESIPWFRSEKPDGGWEDWERPVTKERYVFGGYNRGDSLPPSSFAAGVVTISEEPYSSPHPLKPCQVVTDKRHATAGYFTQWANKYNSTKRYTRTAKSNNTWTPWVEVTTTPV